MTVREATFVGSGLRVRLACGDMRLEARVAPDVTPVVGEEVGVVIPPEAVWRFPDEAVRAPDDGALAP